MTRCEYLFHRSGVVIQSLSTLELTIQRHFCSILEHESSEPVESAVATECVDCAAGECAQASAPAGH